MIEESAMQAITYRAQVMAAAPNIRFLCGTPLYIPYR